MKGKKTKADNLILSILIIILLAVAILSGVSYGYEKGVNFCNKYYYTYINNHCVCYDPINVYQTERFIPIPTTVLNLSSS